MKRRNASAATTAGSASGRRVGRIASWAAVATALALSLLTWQDRAGDAAGAAADDGHRDAAREGERPQARDYSLDCTTAGCHAELLQTPRIHAPVAVRDCATCHEAVGESAEHRFRATRDDKGLCTFCHELSADDYSFQHQPYADHDCVGCHDPHGGATGDFLKGTSLAETCGSCHEDCEEVYGHEPVAAGDCRVCHEMHQGDHPSLLVKPELDLCNDCHRDQIEAFRAADRVHEPVLQQCSACHRTHGGDHKALLHQEPEFLCGNCHGDVVRGVERVGSLHGPVMEDKDCAGCHSPHMSHLDKLLVTEEVELCLACHDRPIEVVGEAGSRPGRPQARSGDLQQPPSPRKKRARGQREPAPKRIIADIRKAIAEAKFVHGPVAEGKCVACHLPHSSSHRSLLRGQYPETIYTDFADTAYGVCFTCHEKPLATEERTTLTKFRDGDRNLHFVHVNRDKGRTCFACHETHGSQQEALMRGSLPFGPGGWTLVLDYERTANGGRCGASCHQEQIYDRVTPSTKPLAPGTTRVPSSPETSGASEPTPDRPR